MSEPRLDWTTAKVSDAKLTVEVDGELPRGWKGTFEAVAKLLDGADFDKVSVKHHSVRVHGVTPGSEENVRHFLESVIQQTNVDHDLGDTASDDSDDPDGDDDESTDDRSDSPDAGMTSRFREFADAPDETA